MGTQQDAPTSDASLEPVTTPQDSANPSPPARSESLDTPTTPTSKDDEKEELEYREKGKSDGEIIKELRVQLK